MDRDIRDFLTTYQYQPLNRDNGDIRLLHLLPAKDDTSPIRCRLKHAPLENQNTTVYEALSYTWGSSERTASIHVEDREFRVTHNLAQALKALRQPESTRTLWIDAICINQEDNEERAAEVLRMLRIYQNATGVVVWLGPGSDSSKIAVQHIRFLEAEYLAQQQPSWLLASLPVLNRAVALGYAVVSPAIRLYFTTAWLTLAWSGWLSSLPYFALRAIMHTVTFLAASKLLITVFCSYHAFMRHLANVMTRPSPEAAQSLRDFFGHRWFHRAWIIQEVAAAQKVTLLCGSNQLTWRTLCRAVSAMQERSDRTHAGRLALIPAWDFQVHRRDRQP
ncbi:heterokaryon incompatibility protein-domain-containing protein [Microdochium trichocladiopsis]|uniref:Heterokaryon incompatibility protein-domain-containing protein n=1 Tax=Microdochium trichocladiopsis TaxID=1682393 RepID=A0A9P8YCB5_9PEZI|nr:heterokaryon incompatibility protein-domain-containing protein [Microdochium trichocladiopsis]KAH7033577.1 heterokaryon incompatibility protein-domain-containing protein [Microdochium trichocladiopsis]